MSAATYTTEQLAMNLADRLNKSLRLSGYSVGDLASFLEVHRNTVSSWLGGRAKPNPATLRQWAEHTGVTYDWLCDRKPQETEPSTSKR